MVRPMSELLRMRDRTLVPPCGFTYTDKDSRITLKAGHLEGLIAMARAHRQVNEFHIPADFDARVEDDLCRRIPVTMISAPPGVVPQTSHMGSIDEITGKTDALMRVAKRNGGRMLCPTEEAKARGTVCLTCPQNARIMCPACNGVLDWLKVNWHLPSFEFDSRLYVCRMNRILNKAQIHLDRAVIVGLAGAASLAAMPETCWKRALLARPKEPAHETT